MVVGICRIALFIPHARTLKDKRAVVQSIVGRVRARHNVSVAEVDAQDCCQRAVVGVAVAGSDARVVRRVLDNVLGIVDGCGESEVTDCAIELVRPVCDPGQSR